MDFFGAQEQREADVPEGDFAGAEDGDGVHGVPFLEHEGGGEGGAEGGQFGGVEDPGWVAVAVHYVEDADRGGVLCAGAGGGGHEGVA